MVQQPLIVEREKPLERVGRPLEAARLEHARDERRRAVPDHAADVLLGERPAAARLEQGVRRVREIAPGIDQRAVEIEDDETEGAHRRRKAEGEKAGRPKG